MPSQDKTLLPGKGLVLASFKHVDNFSVKVDDVTIKSQIE